jgi:hypothetical protein
MRLPNFIVLVLLAYAEHAAAQMPGAPVLQNAWAAPGFVAAANFGGGSDGSVYAAAGSWTATSGRFQLSGGAGFRSGAGSGSNSVYGVRVAMPFGSATGSVGFGAFAGVGGGTRPSTGPDSTAKRTVFPVGLAVGWRRALGATRGISAYATPSYFFASGGSTTGGLFRTALGVDVGLTKVIGATVGVEFGQNRPRGEGGPSGTLFGVGLSFAGGRR